MPNSREFITAKLNLAVKSGKFLRAIRIVQDLQKVLYIPQKSGKLCFPWISSLSSFDLSQIFPEYNNPRIQTVLDGFKQKADEFDSVIKDRNSPEFSHIKFCIGQVMSHKKHDYQGVIVEYDSKCQADQEWKEHMNVAKLERGENQPFYTVLVKPSQNRTETTYGMLWMLGC